MYNETRGLVTTNVMHLFKNYPKHTLFEKIDDSILNYFEKNRAPSTVSSSAPLPSPKYWVYLFDDNIKFVTLSKIGFLKYRSKLFDSNTTSASEKDIRNKQMQISLHLRGYEHSFNSIYFAFIAGAFNLIYIYQFWLKCAVSIGVLGNKRLSDKLADRYILLRYISNYYNSHKDDLGIVLHNEFGISEFIAYVIGTKNILLIYDLKGRIEPYLRALSADNLIALDRDCIRITDDFWSEYVRLRPKGFSIEISYRAIKSGIILLAAIATIIGAIPTFLMFMKPGS